MKANKFNLIIKIKNKDEFDQVIERAKKAVEDLNNFEFDIDVQKESVAANDAITLDSNKINALVDAGIIRAGK